MAGERLVLFPSTLTATKKPIDLPVRPGGKVLPVPTDKPQTSTKESGIAASRNTTTAIVMVVTVMAIANAFGVWLVYDLRWYNKNAFVSFLIGGLIAQPCLLATWAGLARQSTMKRYSVSLAVLIGLTFSYLGFLNFFENGLPVEVAVIILGISVFLFLFSAGLMHVYRWKSGQSLCLHQEKSAEKTSNQFAISHLLIATTVISLLIAVAKWAYPTGGFETAGGAPWLEIMSFVALFFLFALSIYLTTTLALLQESTFAPGLVAVICEVIFGSIVINLILGWNFFGMGAFIDSVFNAICFSIGLIGCQSAVLLIFRSLGFRLRHF